MNRIVSLSFGLFAIYLSSFFPNIVLAHEHEGAPSKQEVLKKTSVAFIENKGQWDDGSSFRLDIPNGLLRISKTSLIYSFANANDLNFQHKAIENGKQATIHGHTYHVNFNNANLNSTFDGQEKLPNYNNYFIGNDPSKWASNVGNYTTVLQNNLYNGIDIKYYTGKSQLKYDLIVKKGANPELIQMSFKGVKPILQNDGSIKIITSVNEVIEQAPYSYQIINGKEVAVASKFKLTNEIVSFEFPQGYNKEYNLIIDPNLIFATYSGGPGTSSYFAHSNAYDKQGNTFAAALATGNGWPTTPGAFMTTTSPTNQACIHKYTPNASALIFSTYFGGNTGVTIPNTIRVSDAGELIVSGSTTSPNLPISTGAFQSTLKGLSDIYVVRFNIDGTGLIACSYVGGTGVEASPFTQTYQQAGLGNLTSPVDIAFDTLGNIWVGTNSASTDFPITPNAFQSTKNSSNDIVLFKINPTLSSIMYATYLGGSSWDGAAGLEFNPNNNSIGLTGITNSTDFPISAGTFQNGNAGGYDAFVALFDNTTYLRLAATLIGTSSQEWGYKISFDCGDNVYIAGSTNSQNFPVTNTVGQGMVPGGNVFIVKLDPTLSNKIASTTTGASGATSGNDWDGWAFPTAMIVDVCGDILIATMRNYLAQSGLPLTPDAFDATPRVVYFAKFKPNFTNLMFGSYYGDESEHFHAGLTRMDPKGVFYHSVCATSANFPTTTWSIFPNKLNAGFDIITFKFDYEINILDAQIQSGLGGYDDIGYAVRGCKSAFIKYTRNGDTTVPMILNYNVVPGGGNIAYQGTDFQSLSGSLTFGAYERTKSLEIKPLIVANMPTGPKMVIIEALNPCGCDGSLSDVIRRDTVYILDSLNIDINSPLPAYCPGDIATIIGTVDTDNLEFHWTPSEYDLGTTTINPVMTTTRTFILTVSQPGAPPTCPKVKRKFVAVVEQFPIINMPSDTNICIQDSVAIPVSISPDSVIYNYNWNPGNGLRATNIGTNFFYQPIGTYTYTLTVSTQIANCTTSKNITINVIPPFELSNIFPASGTIVNYEDRVNMSADGGVLYTWLPVGNYVDPTLQSPTTLPIVEPGYYYVTGIDEYGCKDTAAIWLDVKYPDNPIMPNAFTPNKDNLNDVFKIPNGKYVKVQRFEVYNRWGKRVFNTIDGNIGWDGTDEKNKKPCAQGVYMYVVSIELPNKEIKTIKGDVTLLR